MELLNLQREVMHMKKATLDPTDENILQTIKDNGTGGRNKEIKEFVEALDMIESNMFICLDADWGTGKTFYVRQIEKTLEYHTLKKINEQSCDEQYSYNEMCKYFSGTELEEIDTENSYLPIYYNAWLYDNHCDPLLSLMSVIVKKAGNVNTKISMKLKERILSVLKSVEVSLPFGVPISVNISGITDALTNKELLEKIQLAEDVMIKIKQILNCIICEDINKMVIFIDELDRCKPSYALELLERIKHYFDNDNIIFIISLNKEQLTHTITNYYGAGFDSTGYLNKFFDLDMYLPEVQTVDKTINSYVNTQYWINTIANALSKYYNLSLRDALIYKQKIKNLEEDSMIEDHSSWTPYKGLCLSLFIPIIIILRMKNIEEARKFENGTSNILQKMIEIHEIGRFYKNLGEDGFEKINVIYRYAFGNEDEIILKEFNVQTNDIDINFKRDCLKRVSKINV